MQLSNKNIAYIQKQLIFELGGLNYQVTPLKRAEWILALKVQKTYNLDPVQKTEN